MREGEGGGGAESGFRAKCDFTGVYFVMRQVPEDPRVYGMEEARAVLIATLGTSNGCCRGSRWIARSQVGFSSGCATPPLVARYRKVCKPVISVAPMLTPCGIKARFAASPRFTGFDPFARRRFRLRPPSPSHSAPRVRDRLVGHTQGAPNRDGACHPKDLRRNMNEDIFHERVFVRRKRGPAGDPRRRGFSTTV